MIGDDHQIHYLNYSDDHYTYTAYYFSEGHFFKFAGYGYKIVLILQKIKPKLYNDSELENAWHCSITLRFDSENDKAPL